MPLPTTNYAMRGVSRFATADKSQCSERIQSDVCWFRRLVGCVGAAFINGGSTLHQSMCHLRRRMSLSWSNSNLPPFGSLPRLFG